MSDTTLDPILLTNSLLRNGGSSQTPVGPDLSQTSDPPNLAWSRSNAILGAQSAATEEGSQSFSDIASDLVTKAIPLTGASIVNSFVNTAVEVGNFLGGDFQKATIEDEFGPDSETTAYYQQHAGPIEGVGLAVGSLLPGLGAIKVLKLAQAGQFGSTMAFSTGLMSGMRATALKAATEDLVGNATGQSLFGLTSANKIKGILAGIGDEALQGAVYEVGTLATMHASPITDENTLGDNISDVIDSAKSFGVLGGLIKGATFSSEARFALRKADVGSKAFEASGAQGLGNITPGDRIVSLYDTLDKIPEPTDRLSSMKLNATKGTTDRLIQEQLIKAAGGDEELAGSFRNFLEDGRKAGSISPEELTNNLSQLSQLGRHGDTDVVSQSRDAFYIPSLVPQDVLPTASHDDLMSRISEGSTAKSRAYQLTSPTSLPIIGKASDTLQITGARIQAGLSAAPKFSNVTDAYKQGIDIFIDASGKTHINPDSTSFKEVARPGESRVLSKAERDAYETTGNLPPGSKPLNAVGLTLDVTSGKLFGESPLPVVGDIAKPKLYGPSNNPSGLLVGSKIFPQKVGEEFSPLEVNPLDANSRYVWAAMRGLKPGDAIHPTDLPMMEQAYREMVAGFDHEGLDTFSDGSEFPLTAPGLLEYISSVKQYMYPELLAAGKNADEIGHILNSPTAGLTKNFNSSNPSDLIMGWDRYLKDGQQESANIKHVRLAYDIGTTKDSEGNLLRGMLATNYRIQLAKDAGSTQMGNYLAQTIGAGDSSGKADAYFRATQFTKGSGDADILGAGSKFLSNANASYGTMAEQAQRMGRATGELLVQRNSAVSDTLSASTNILKRDPAASAEYGNFRAVRQSTGENYVFLSDADAVSNGLPQNTVVLEGAVSKDAKTGAVTVNKNYLPPGFIAGSESTAGVSGTNLKNFYTLSQPVADLERASQSLNNFRNSLRTDWWKAQGLAKEPYNPDILYTPPIDTSKSSYFAYVREREGYALGQSGAHVMTAGSAEELQRKISLLGPNYDAFSKGDVANFKKAQGEYEWSRNFQNNQVATEMARKGILNNVVPETRGQNLVDSLVNWHFKQEASLLRDHVELHNAATFDQLKAMGDRWEQTGVSKFGAITPFTQRTATNPYMTYVRTALGLSPKDEYPLWQLAQDKLESFAGTAFNAVKDAFGATQKGLLPVEQAAKVSEKFGLGNPYGTTLEEMSKSYYGGLANQLPDPGIFRKFVATANSALGATVIRLDTFQQMIHAVTLPIMIALEHSSASKEMGDLLTVGVPGTTQQVPSFSKTLYNGIRNYFQDTDGKLAQMYSVGAGLTRDELQIHRSMIDQLSMPLGKLSDSGWAQKIDGAAQSAQKLTGTTFTNKFLHFVASDVGRQIGEASGLTGQTLLDSIGTFTNRVLGNIAAGQRASIFSGPVGQAVGLFQSYQWNMMQQLLRHIGEGNVKGLAMAAGMQSTIFGLSSLPGFHALNSIIADRHGNTQGQDLYSGTNEMFGPKVADYLLYGSLSGLLGTSLYSRGDLNPRRASILPVNPLNFPSVAAGVRVYQTLAQLESNITTKGGDVPASLMLAAEHNGLSRPLAGLAELAQGFSTAPNGNLISKNAGLSDLSSIATMSRILGARPLEESVAMDSLYRMNSLKVLDRARLEELGESAKTALRGDSPIAAEVSQQFMSDYVKAGGNQQNFNQWFLQQGKDANVGAINKAFENFHNPIAQGLQKSMGGQPLPDFRTQPNTQASSP